jgi:hypothetical protein
LDHSQALSKNMEHVAFARLARDSAFELMLTLVLLFGVVSIVRWVIGPSPISRAMWRFGVFPATGIVPYAIAQLLGSIVGVVAARAVWTDGGLSMYPESNRLDRMEALRLWTVGAVGFPVKMARRAPSFRASWRIWQYSLPTTSPYLKEKSRDWSQCLRLSEARRYTPLTNSPSFLLRFRLFYPIGPQWLPMAVTLSRPWPLLQLAHLWL